MTINDKFSTLCNTPSDINEHLPILKKYATGCNVVVELGVRWVVSTYAFLAATPNKLISVDIKHPAEWGGASALEEVQLFANDLNVDFSFIQASSLDVTLPNHDLLFIDTWHCYRQLLSELNMHHSNVNKYIILHDTTLFEFVDETAYGESGTGNEVGLWPAVEKFILENPEWSIKERNNNNNGLTVLAKNDK
jgi:hypothetical protein